MGNDVPIPFNPVTDSVKNYGAVGDGIVDDSRAFLAAIASLKPGSVLFVPAGALLPGSVLHAAGGDSAYSAAQGSLVCCDLLEDIKLFK